MERGIVIIGAGHAGCRAAQSLRPYGWAGAIHLINGEERAPYERPPLSKSVLLQQKETSQIPLLRSAWLEDDTTFYHEGVRVTTIDRTQKTLALSNGQSLTYESLLIATGAKPRTLDFGRTLPAGVMTLRSAVHAEALGDTLLAGKRLVIIGGGLIGLEVAAAAVGKGCGVTVLETAPRLLARVVPAEIASEVRKDHEAAGIQFRLNTSVEGIIGDAYIKGVRLASDEEIPCDLLLVSIGVSPETTLAEASGLEIDNGIVVDKFLRTSDPAIFAAGDVSSIRRDESLRPQRLECWKNAEDQGELVARNMLGHQVPYEMVPWMWSDQFDKVIQAAGWPVPNQSITLRPLASGGIAAFHHDRETLVAVSAYGAIGVVAKAVRVGSTMLQRGMSPAPGTVCAVADLRELLQVQQAA
ncbi:FAD-dependent oxidoreductase [Mesorhizobium sp.]|uniref:NAD(P)/FAD-dependent oxidoreductase n=1 Tax=Mesorhizobium sp. TaxID=1871066 RepID=UPI0025C1FC1D|nr:FAD-dependent oxidoreductase [Mesorhizobium sp.]